MNTNFFILEINSENYHQDLQSISQYFNFSNYDKTHSLYSLENKAKLSKFKDEIKDKKILEIICLCSKMYSILCNKLKLNKMKIKDIRELAKKKLKHENYNKCLIVAEQIINQEIKNPMLCNIVVF